MKNIKTISDLLKKKLYGENINVPFLNLDTRDLRIKYYTMRKLWEYNIYDLRIGKSGFENCYSKKKTENSVRWSFT